MTAITNCGRRFRAALAFSMGGAVLALGLSPGVQLYAQTACGATPSGAVFWSGFEEGNKSIWNDYDGNPDSENALVQDPGPCNRAENHVIRLFLPPGRGVSDLIKVLPTSHDRLYARWYQKWEAGYDFSAQNHGSGLHAGDRSYLGRSEQRPSGADWFSAWHEPQAERSATLNRRASLYTYYRGMNQLCSGTQPGAQSGCYGDSFPRPSELGNVALLPPQYVADRWYCVEMMMDGGTPTTTQAGANGAFAMWVDGVPYGPWTGLWLRTTANLKVGILWLSLFHHGNHSVAGTRIDDVVVSTNPIGCHGAAPPPPPAPPPPGLPGKPQNLRIIPGVPPAL